MKKISLIFALVLTTVASAWAQQDGKSFETAFDLVAGENSASELVTVESYYTGAYFQYTATEATILKCSAINCYSFSFYNAEHGQLTSSYVSENGKYAYILQMEAGQKAYVLAKQGYGSAETSVSFKADLIAGDTNHGASADDPRIIEDGNSYWFNYYYAYMKYTATDDGVLVLGYNGSDYGSTYTVDGNTVTLNYDNTDHVYRIPVEAGKVYDIALYTSSRSLFNVTVALTHPSVGDTIDNPFTMQLGDNTVPSAPGKYWYSFTNGDKAGFVTINAFDATIKVRGEGYSYDNILDGATGIAKFQVEANTKYIVSIQKEGTVQDAVATVSFAEPQAGELESNPIAITPSADGVISVPAGSTLYYTMTTGQNGCFINAKVLSGWVSASTCRMKAASESYYSSSFYDTYDLHYQAATNTKYIFQIFNAGAEELKFSVWTEDIAQGDFFNDPIEAVAGTNVILPVGSSTKYFTYTPATSCRLEIAVPEGVTVTFPYMNWGYEYENQPAKVEGNTYSYNVTAGTPLIFKLAGVQPRQTFTVTETVAGAGESRSTAIEYTEPYTLTGTPSTTWLVYTAPADGVANINAAIDYISWYDHVYYYINDEETKHDIAVWDYDKNAYTYTGNAALSAGDKLYIQIELTTNQDGKVVTIEMREPDPGEAPTNPLVLVPGVPTAFGAVAWGGANAKWLSFTTVQPGLVELEAGDYTTINIYKADDLSNPLCTEAYFGGDYYGKFSQEFNEVGTYLVKVMYSYYGDQMTASGSAFGDTPTAINGVNVNANENVYNLAGQRVNGNQKGIVIKNGKKYIK